MADSCSPCGARAADRCPLCGQPNDCAAARGEAQACWCMNARIDPAVLARLPAAERGQRCICARCAGAAGTPAAPA